MQVAENFAYRHAYKVVSMLPKTIEYMVRHGMNRESFVYVPNGIELRDMQEASPLDPATEAMLPRGKFVVGYAGTIGIANSMKAFVVAAGLLQNVQEICFVVVGDGVELEELKGLARSKNLTNTTFIPPIRKTQVQAMLAHFDLCYIGLKEASLYRFGISPNKIFDYMYAAKPIVMAIDAGNDFALDAQCGVSVEPGNPAAIAEAILKLYSSPKAERLAMGENGKAYVLRYHTFDRLAAKFRELFEN
jgi:glycosyltransferase involved in cell wall biosynthesis